MDGGIGMLAVASVVGAAFLIGSGAAAYAVASRLVTRGGSGRIAVAMVGVYAIAALTFLALGMSGGMNLGTLAVIAAGLCGAGWSRRAALAGSLETDRERVAQWWRQVRAARLHWLGGFVGAVAALRFARALASPPMGTDALTYHLFRAGEWARAQGIVHEQAPDAWGYYDYYPTVGDGLYALTLVFGRGDLWLGATQALVYATLVFGGYAASRAVGTSRVHATLVALGVGSLPSVLSFATAAYVDGMVLALFLLGLAALFGAGERGPGVAMLAFGIAAGIKVTGLPLLLIGGVVAGVRTWRHFGRDGWRVLALAGLMGLVIAAPAYLRGLIEQGNPLYPFGLSVGGQEIWVGNEENTLLQTGALAPTAVTQFEVSTFLRTLFVPRASFDVQHLNLGPVAPLVMVLGAWGLVRATLDPGRRLWGAALLCVVGLFVWRLGSPGMLAHRTFAAPAVGRFLSVPTAAMFLAAGLVAPRVLVPVAWAAVLVGAALSFPAGLSSTELVPTAMVLAAVAVAVATTWIVARRKRVASLGVAAASVGVLALALDPLRADVRHQVWSEGVDALAFYPHPTDPRASQAWPIWQHLDDLDPTRIAFAAGWDGRGHHWYRYPLLGHDLRHDVVYVPVTRDGEIVDYREHDRLLAHADPRAWLRRLVDHEVTYLVVAAPKSLETIWTAGLPDVFEVVVEAGPHRLYRVNAPAARARMRGG